MTEEQFIQQNNTQWQQLESLINQMRKKGVRRLRFEQLSQLDASYRRANAHLAYAQTYFPHAHTTAYLNGIVSTAHNLLLVKKRSGWRTVLSFFMGIIPGSLRSSRGMIVLSAIIFIASIAFSFLYVWFDPQSAARFLPPQYLNAANMPVSSAGTGGILNGAIFSGLLMSNNIQVAALAFALGVTGFGTGYILWQNGLLLGALSALVCMTPPSNILNYWSLILPHGVLELSAICISGGAGLQLFWAILFPKQHSRRDALIKASYQAAVQMVFVVILLIIAALIEGNLTPSNLSPVTKLSFAALTAILLASYCSLAYLPFNAFNQDRVVRQSNRSKPSSFFSSTRND